jgi:predicted phage-related endonuclease
MDRKTYLGSHDTSAIFGENPFMTPMTVFMSKTGMLENTKQTERMSWGLKSQPMILKEFADVKSVELEPERFIRHETLDWFGGTPDATIAGRREGVDAKNIRYANPAEWGDPGTDSIPPYILWQCHHFLTLLDYDAWHVAVLIGGQEFRIYTVYRDTELSKIIIDTDGAFWRDHVLPRVPPDIDYTDSSRKYLQLKNKCGNKTIRDAVEADSVLIAQLKMARELLSETEQNVKLLENKICEQIGTDYGISSPEIGRAIWSDCKGRESVDTKLLKTELPEIYQKYAKRGEPYRTLRVTFCGTE